MHFDTLNEPADITAKKLLGSYLIRRFGKKDVVCKIVETEAYCEQDEASHSFRGKTNRTKVMFGEPGFAYVYFTYGMHYCLNIVCQPKGQGAAVLIRAVEPITGIDLLKANRPGIIKDTELVNGPAKLTKALLIDQSFYGHNFKDQPLILKINKPFQDKNIMSTRRIGITKDVDKLWRFYLKDSPYVSAHTQ